MKKVFDFTNLLIPIILIIVTSCNNDDSSIPIFSARDVDGTYSGKVLITQDATLQAYEIEAALGINISAEIREDTVFFTKFPVDDIIISIVGAEQAPAIIKAIGNINYKVGYRATVSTKQDSIFLAFAPKPLELILPGEEKIQMKVKVTFSTVQQGNFAYKSQQLKFVIKANKVEVNEVELPSFMPTDFDFNLKKR